MTRRIGHLWEPLTSFPHLLWAAQNSARGKRWKPGVLKFHSEREHELIRLQEELRTKTYQPGPCHTFEIREPKPRLISAARYRDRVVHHALTGILEPIWERCFLHDCCACRKGRGTHAGMRRVQEFARRQRWVWKADLRKYSFRASITPSSRSSSAAR